MDSPMESRTQKKGSWRGGWQQGMEELVEEDGVGSDREGWRLCRRKEGGEEEPYLCHIIILVGFHVV